MVQNTQKQTAQRAGEHKEPDIPPGGDQTKAKRKVNTGCGFIR